MSNVENKIRELGKKRNQQVLQEYIDEIDFNEVVPSILFVLVLLVYKTTFYYMIHFLG